MPRRQKNSVLFVAVPLPASTFAFLLLLLMVALPRDRILLDGSVIVERQDIDMVLVGVQIWNNARLGEASGLLAIYFQIMDIVKTFGGAIERTAVRDPLAARKLLRAGYRAQAFMLAHHPDKNLPASEQYAAQLAMALVRRALIEPQNAAMVSLFVPCEPFTSLGITPYSVELMSCFIAGTKCSAPFLEASGACGMPETMCSYHRTFIGAVETSLMPTPRFTVYTNLACDGNMITFPHLRDLLELPAFEIDVPYEKSEDSVSYVADQLREMVRFIEGVMGRTLDEEKLRASVERSRRSMESYRAYCQMNDRLLPCDLTSEMYLVLMSHILLGTSEAERLFEMLASDKASCVPVDPTSSHAPRRLLWVHLIPNMQPSVRTLLNMTGRVGIATCELVYDNMVEMDASHPYESMARRMVYSPYNGSAQDRIERALSMAEMTKADGAIVFAHWGCKATEGTTHLMKAALEDAGYPTLVLDGDGCDPANASDGQTATRLEAFLELLEARR